MHKIFSLYVVVFLTCAIGGIGQEDKAEHEKSIKEHTEEIKANPKDAKAYFRRGGHYQALGKHFEAIKDYTKVIEIEPDNSQAYEHRGHEYLYSEPSKGPESIADFTYAIRINP